MHLFIKRVQNMQIISIDIDIIGVYPAVNMRRYAK